MIKSIMIENKSMVNLHGVKPGKQIEIKVDAKGVPLDQHWRRRLRDSATDGCIAVVETAQPKVKASKKEAE